MRKPQRITKEHNKSWIIENEGDLLQMGDGSRIPLGMEEEGKKMGKGR